jgi:hypothetical protein
MKQTIFVFIILFFSSCSFFDQQARIEFDNSQKTIDVLSENFKISNIFIKEITKKKADSAFTSINFEKPVKGIYLKKIRKSNYSGQPINEIINKQNLEYTIILKGNLDNIEIARSIIFTSNDAKTEKVFYSNF